MRVRFEAGAQRGQFTVTPVADSEFSLAADAVVVSIGQDPDLAPVQALLEGDGALLKVDARQATSVERVYAGGDVSSMARFVTEAIGMGQRAAHAIDRALRAGAAAPLPRTNPWWGSARSTPSITRSRDARPSKRLDAARRLASTTEVQLGFDLEQALAETERCFSCGTCIFCDNCVNYCPDLAVKRLPDGASPATWSTPTTARAAASA